MTDNFYPEQYRRTGQFPINHNYLQEQFADYKDILRKVGKVVANADFTLGAAVDHFEKKFSELNQGKYGIGVGSGTDALFLSLKALGIGAGDEIITTPFTFVATVGAIVTAGAKPVFVDIGSDHNINVALIEEAVTNNTKVILPVHWAGVPCDMQAINRIAKRHALTIVADACHAIKSRYHGAGIASVADVSCFSMHPLKNLNVWGDGGVIVTDDRRLAETLYLIRNHGLSDRDHCQKWAYNSRLDTIQAVVAQHLLDNRIDQITDQRIANARYLDQALAGLCEVTIPERDDANIAVFHLYMAKFKRRDQLQVFLNELGIDAKVHYPVPMHLQPAARDFGYKVGDFPETEALAKECLSLPVHEFISEEQLAFMVTAIKRFYEAS